MSSIRNTILAALTISLSILNAQAASPKPALEKKQLKIGLAIEATTYLPIYLADSKGFFKEEGLDVKLYTFKGDAGAIQALAGNSVDVNIASLSGVVHAINAGQPMVAFWGGFNQADFDWYSPTLKSLKDAKGAKFGISQYGSLTDMLTRDALRDAGLNPEKDAQIMQIGAPAAALAAMVAGQLDAAILSAPSKYAAKDKGMYHLLSERRDLTPTWPKHVIYSSKAFLKKNPETTKAFLRAMTKGLDYIKTDKEGAADEIIKRLGFDKKYALLAVEEVTPDFERDGKIDPRGLQAFWKLAIEAGDVTEAWKDEKWLDSSLINSSATWLQQP